MGAARLVRGAGPHDGRRGRRATPSRVAMTAYLVTGGSGFVGQWIARALIERGDPATLSGIEPLDERARVLNAKERRAVHWVHCDVRSREEIDAMIDAAEPEVVIHLAGVAFPPDADADPTATYDINVLGAVRLLGSLARRRRAGTLDPVIVVVGTSLQYGLQDLARMPLTEDADQRPLSVYAASKAAQEVVALQTARSGDLRVICTRSFNQSGAGQEVRYLLPSIVHRVKHLAASGEGSLTIGNDVLRDYLHVRDAVAAYLALAERGIPGEVYNVASG